MKIKNENGGRGFTIIELLIVVAIIGILATLMLLSYSHSLKRGRDARRVSDIESVKLACNMFADKTGGYPVASSWNNLILGDYLKDYVDIDNINDPKSSLYSYGYTGVDGSDCSFEYYSEVGEDLKTVQCKD